MNLISIKAEGRVKDLLSEQTALAKGGLYKGAAIGARRLVTDLRAHTAAALGVRVANAWRAMVFPKRPTSWGPSAYIYTKAPTIVLAFEQAALIRGKSGNWLAIPTENVPRRGRSGKAMTPVEVEGRFNVELDMVPSLRGGVALLVMPAVRAKNKRGWRSPTAARLKAGRNVQRVVMFILVKQVRLRKKLNVAAIERRWAPESGQQSWQSVWLRLFGTKRDANKNRISNRRLCRRSHQRVAANLPGPTREERSLEEFDPVTGFDAALRWAVFDGSRVELDRTLGSVAETYALARDVEVEIAVSATDQIARFAVFDKILELVSVVITADFTLGGIVSDISVQDDVRVGLVFDGVADIKATSLTIRLTYWSPEPF